MKKLSKAQLTSKAEHASADDSATDSREVFGALPNEVES